MANKQKQKSQTKSSRKFTTSYIYFIVIVIIVNRIRNRKASHLEEESDRNISFDSKSILTEQIHKKSVEKKSKQKNHIYHSEETWLDCLKSIQTIYYDAFQIYFTNPVLVRNRKILFIDPANHDNFGDTLLAESVFKFLATFGIPRKNVVTCKIGQSHKKVPRCRDFSQFKRIKLAIWQPGGNWGDLYWNYHERRINTFRNLLKNGFWVLGMPQSLHFKSDYNVTRDGINLKKEIEASGVPLRKAKNRIVLCWRQKNSYETALKVYPFVQNWIVPDMAFQIGPLLEQDRFPNSLNNIYDDKKYDIVFIMRGDNESIYKKYRNDKAIREILDKIPGGHKITFILDDWPTFYSKNKYYQRVDAAVRNKTSLDLDFDLEVHEALSYVSLGKVLITDRLHGSIFGFLAYKPHVYLENSYKKISLTREVAFGSSQSRICKNKKLMHYNSASGMEDALKKAIKMLNQYY